jgi:hypothetical protein
MSDSSIVLITGGNTGIGYETVKALYASPEAHTILMGSRSMDKAVEAIKTLESEVQETKSTVVPIQIDIEDDASIEKAFKEVESKYGKVDALVNNAGKSQSKVKIYQTCTRKLQDEIWQSAPRSPLGALHLGNFESGVLDGGSQPQAHPTSPLDSKTKKNKHTLTPQQVAPSTAHSALTLLFLPSAQSGTTPTP